MTFRLIYLGLLKRYASGTDGIEERSPSGESLDAILRGSPLEASGLGYTFIVAGSRAKGDYVPADGDAVRIMPLFCGG